MRLGGASCWAGASGTFDRAEVEAPGLREAFESRQNITCRAHVSWFFLHPDNLARFGMLLDGSSNFCARQRVELIEKENGGSRVLTAAAVRAELLADLFAGHPDAVSGLHFAVWDQRH